MLKDKKGTSVTIAFLEILDKFGEVCNRSMKLWLHDNGSELYLTYNGLKATCAYCC